MHNNGAQINSKGSKWIFFVAILQQMYVNRIHLPIIILNDAMDLSQEVDFVAHSYKFVL